MFASMSHIVLPLVPIVNYIPSLKTRNSLEQVYVSLSENSYLLPANCCIPRQGPLSLLYLEQRNIRDKYLEQKCSLTTTCRLLLFYKPPKQSLLLLHLLTAELIKEGNAPTLTRNNVHTTSCVSSKGLSPVRYTGLSKN